MAKVKKIEENSFGFFIGKGHHTSHLPISCQVIGGILFKMSGSISDFAEDLPVGLPQSHQLVLFFS